VGVHARRFYDLRVIGSTRKGAAELECFASAIASAKGRNDRTRAIILTVE
jgi:hypothetical protein